MAKTTDENINNGSVSEKLNQLIALTGNVNQSLKDNGVD